MTIGERIYKYRKKAGISQEELADALEVTRQSVSLWETDQTLPSTANLIRLTEIFHITMDELCGSSNGGQNSESAEKGEGVEKFDCSRSSDTSVSSVVTEAESSPQPIARVTTGFNEKIAKAAHKIQLSKVYVGFSVLIAFMLLWIVMIPFSDSSPFLVILPILVIVVSISFIIGMVVASKKAIINELRNRPNHNVTVSFYADRFEVVSTSDTANAQYGKKYTELKKVRNDKDNIYLFFDKLFAPVAISQLGENTEAICRLLKLDVADVTGVRRPVVKTALSAMFILSILSLFAAMATVVIVFNLSPMPEYSQSMTEYMWVFFLYIPIPLSSAMLGIVYAVKKYKCIKNIVAGVVIIFFLTIYGSFTFVFARGVKHDYEFVKKIESELPFDLPDDGIITYDVSGKFATEYDAMIKPANGEEVIKLAKEYGWATEYKQLNSHLINEYTTATIKNYDYFYIYDADCKISGAELSGDHDGHALIMLAYSEESNILRIYKYTVE